MKNIIKPSINLALNVIYDFRNRLPIMTPEAAKKDIKRQVIELKGAADMAVIQGDQSGAALLIAVAEILKLARKTNDVQSLESLRMAILLQAEYRDCIDSDPCPF